MNLNELIEILLKMKEEHGDKQVCLMLEIESPVRVQINDIVKDVASTGHGVVLIGSEWR